MKLKEHLCRCCEYDFWLSNYISKIYYDNCKDGHMQAMRLIAEYTLRLDGYRFTKRILADIKKWECENEDTYAVRTKTMITQ